MFSARQIVLWAVYVCETRFRKFAHTVPIYKKGSKAEMNNYRPVSLTNVVCKVMESIIRNHVMSVCLSVASRLQRVSLIVIPFCLSVCLSVIPWPTVYHYWSITTKFGQQDPCKPFWIPYLSHTFSARGKICKISPISNTSTVGHAKPYSSYNSWSSLLIFGHNTLLWVSFGTLSNLSILPGFSGLTYLSRLAMT